MTEPVIQTHGLTKHYRDVVALDRLDLCVNQGEVLGYLGPNGSGKTTTIRLLLALSRPSSGSAAIFGLDSQRQALAIHSRLAYIPGEVNPWPGLTGEETLHLLGRLHGSAVDAVYRDTLVRRFEIDLARKVHAYSKGNRQKLLIIAAFMVRPQLLLLDEPSSGLDPLMEQAFRACVREARDNGQTVFLSSHILSEVEVLCDRVAILRSGKLVEIGTLQEMRGLSAVIVEISTAAPPPDLTDTPGVSDLEIQGNHIRCRVTGPIEPLLHALESTSVTRLLSRELSLEELFLAQYGASDGEAGR
jgi:ABC-2 type transport system ATP-binding protein